MSRTTKELLEAAVEEIRHLQDKLAEGSEETAEGIGRRETLRHALAARAKIHPKPVGMTHCEKLALAKTAELWNAMNRLEDKHPDDDLEARQAIHRIQGIIAVRVARRVDPKEWR